MKKTDFAPGTKVLATWDSPEWDEAKIIKYRFSDEDWDTMEGTVTAKEAPAGKVYVKWEECDADIDQDEEQLTDLKLLTLASDRSKIQQEFKDLQKELKVKMKAASALIREAGAMARKHGYVLAETAGYDLYDAMDSAGWRTSSFGC